MKTLLLCLFTLAALRLEAKPVLQTNGTYVVQNPTQSVVLAWDPSPDPGVTSYHLYWGASGSRLYTNWLSTTSATCTVSNLAYGTTYYFAATCVSTPYTNLTLESDFSAEVSYSTPAVPAKTTMHPPVSLVVQVKHSLDGLWADTGMFWSVDPAGTNEFFRLRIVSADPAPAIAPARSRSTLRKTPVSVPASLNPANIERD